MNYQQKYLKYKEKYLQLKNQIGGDSELEKFKSSVVFRGLLSKTVPSFPDMTFLNPLSSQFSRVNDSLYAEITQKIKDNDPSISKEELLKNDNIKLFYNFMKKVTGYGYSENPSFEHYIGKGFLLLFNQLESGIVMKKSCSVHEFMTLEDISICNNPMLVHGSCSWPEFNKTISDINSNNDKIIELFDLIIAKISPDTDINIIIGSIIDEGSEQINILFLPKGGYMSMHYPDHSPKNYHSIDYHLTDIKTNPILSEVYTIDNTFPLNTNGTNKDVLDKILEITKSRKVNFYNKMCGTCFRSMYYLVHNATSNFTYTVNPEQKLSDVNDTADIRKCFKK
jgi:hypothetical protein